MNTEKLTTLGHWARGAALALLAASLGTSADDTEIYKSEFDASSGARPKVLIVFDDSGSMATQVTEERPPYDPTESYDGGAPDGRVYWARRNDDGTVTAPAPDSSQYFSASANRCDASYTPLTNNGRFTPERALRWVDSSIEEGQCEYVCPDGQTYRNPPGPNNAGCYTYETGTVPLNVLVWVQDDSGNDCPGSLYYVDPEGPNNDACYQEVVSSNSTSGWVYRDNDSGNDCSGGLTYLDIEIPGPDNDYDACFEWVSGPAYSDGWVFQGDRVQVCEDDTLIPGTWEDLSESSSSRNTTHVECRDDLTGETPNPSNGSGQADGFPQDNVATGNEYGPDIDNSIDWGSEALTFFTSHYIDYLNDDSLIVTRSRLEIAQDVIGTMIETNTSIDFGLMEFNRNAQNSVGDEDVYDGGRIIQGIVSDMNTTQRENMVTLVESIQASGSTPLCESFYEAYRYIAGKDVLWGNDAAPTSSYSTSDIAPKDTAAESGGTYIQPNSSCAYTYIILMTDGEPQNDSSANSYIKTLTGATSCGSYPFSNQGNRESCMPELAEYMAKTDLDNDSTNGDQYGITYTIGFATNQQLLEDTADKGKGDYYTATNSQELADAFQGALVGILSRETTFTSPAVAVDTFTRTRSRDEVFYAMFEPSLTVDWIGNIKKLKVKIDGDSAVIVQADGTTPAIDSASGDILETATTFWSTSADGGRVGEGGVGALLAARDPATRNVLTNTGNAGALQAFNSTNINATSMGTIDDLALWNLFGASTSDAFNKQLNWALGYDTYDEDDEPSTTVRSWIMGDILHSQPLVVNYGARTNAFTNDNPDMRIISGTNHGFVHMFGNGDGQEDWAFFPKELAEILPVRRRDQSSNDNVYGMDLTPVSYTFDSNSDGTLKSSDGDKVWVFLGMRRGGESYYALDISTPDTPSFLWRIGSDMTAFAELGQTWSEPVVTQIPGHVDANGVPKPALIFGAGYDTNKDLTGLGTADSQGRGVFIVDAATGSLIYSFTPGANSATNLQETGLTHSVPGQVKAFDSNADGLTDRIYFGDTGGNIWRIDLAGNAIPDASNKPWRIVQFAALNGNDEDNDRRFFNAPDVVRIREEGIAIDAVIIGSGDRTNPIALDVQNRLYMLRDEAIGIYSTNRPSDATCSGGSAPDDFRCVLPLRENLLYDITADLINTGDETEQATAQGALDAASGWMMGLEAPGEKSLAETLTINGRVFASTFTPSNIVSDINICEPQAGTGQMYVIDLYTGDRDTIILGSIIPDAPSLHFSEDGSIRVLLPPGAPPNSLDEPGTVDCTSGVCDLGESLRPPYGNYWYQEDY
ncbi:hypothetical protein BST95_06400 [Halioglobus japonicus]|nr:PilC/PilY family type IV pilus protein [Halioglobus japonicus]AQA17922.1 hypothetical protein BST95_06400 [Halioglobus japonicus]GHD18005.1 type IV pili system adhesin PilY [Halioglobus japonicus]